MGDNITRERRRLRERVYYTNNELSRTDGPAVISNNETEIWYLGGVIHRDGDKPAYITPDKIYYYKRGHIHRDETLGPAVIGTRVDEVQSSSVLRGTQYYYSHGMLHRSDGPAVIAADHIIVEVSGTDLSRSTEFPSGTLVPYIDEQFVLTGTIQKWFHSGTLSRTDGMAIIRHDGTGEYWLSGTYYALERDWRAALRER